MLQLTKTISARINFQIKQFVVKILRYGLSDVQEVVQISPFGLSSWPTKDLVALYSPTSEKGKNVIIGYISKVALQNPANPGESYLYSTDETGILKAFVYMKSDGKINLNGSQYQLMRLLPFQEQLDAAIFKINEETIKIKAAITSLGGTYAQQNVAMDYTNVATPNVYTE